MNERVERLRESLEEPLLVTASVNVRYLCGLQSSNVALFIEEGISTVVPDKRRVKT